MTPTAYLDALRAAYKRERRGDFAGALEHLEAAYDCCPSEIESMIGKEIQTVQARLVEQKKLQQGLFGKAKTAFTGRVG